jgi:hypothetical protein
MKMLFDCYKYSKAIDAKGAFSIRPEIIALLLTQHKFKEWFENYQSINRFN